MPIYVNICSKDVFTSVFMVKLQQHAYTVESACFLIFLDLLCTSYSFLHPQLSETLQSKNGKSTFWPLFLISLCFTSSIRVHLWCMKLASLADSTPCNTPVICFFFGICFLGEASSCFGFQQLCATWTRAPYVWNVNLPKITASEGNETASSCMWRNTGLLSILPDALGNVLSSVVVS